MTDTLVEELFEECPKRDRCPHIRKDKSGPYCARDLNKGMSVLQERRNVCCYASLQLWCLDKDRFSKCIWYQGEPFR